MALATDKEGELLRQIILAKGNAKPVIDSYDFFIKHRVFQIISGFQIVTTNDRIIRFENPVFSMPSIIDLQSNRKSRELFPFEARRKNLSYMADLYATVKLYRREGGGLVQEEGQEAVVKLGKMPVLIHSELDRLRGMSPEERVRHGEPEKDPGGYFIIKGTEKVLLNIEKLRTLSPYLYEDKRGYVVRYTSQTLTDTSIIMVFKKQSDVHVTFAGIGFNENDINIFYMFYILGITTNVFDRVYDIMDSFIVDNDPRRQARRRKELRYYLESTANTFSTQSGFNNERIIDFLSSLIKNPYLDTRQTMQTELFKNIPLVGTRLEIQSALVAKIRMLAYMVVKFVEFENGYRKIDDRDSWGNKRLVDVGGHMETRFIHIWKHMINTIETPVKRNLMADITVNQIKTYINQSYMTEQFINSFNNELWGSARGGREVNIVDILNRDTLMASYAHIRRISTPVNRRAKMREKRLIHNTQWGAVCPVMTPEGENCGLVKDSAITTYVSLERPEEIIRSYVDSHYSTIYNKDSHDKALFLNGVILGYCDTSAMRLELLRLRRSQKLYFDTGIILDVNKDLWIYTNAGRLCRPLLLVDKDTQELIIDQKGLRGQSLFQLMRAGALEYLDIAEQEQVEIYIAQTVSHLRSKKNRIIRTFEQYQRLEKDPNATQDEIASARSAYHKYQNEMKFTHCEVDPTAIMGISASIVPLPEFNPGPRVTYQASMGKQALGPNSSRAELRFDTTLRTINTPGVPLFATDAHETLGLDKYPAGQMVLVAITTYGGQNQEDALIVNERAVKLGLFRMTIFHGYKTMLRQSKTHQEKLQVPDFTQSQAPRYSKLDLTTGIAKLGEYVEEGDVLVSKIIVDKRTNETKDDSTRVEVGHKGIVDEVFVTENAEGYKLIQIRLKEIRDLQTGDKLASRYAQKGIVGDILPHEQMPIIKSDNEAINGLRPNIIFNPHGIPSRMTNGKMIEILTGMYAAATGTRINATAFRPFNWEEFQGDLEDLGYSRSGKVRMIYGVTGREMDADIFVGPVYYQLLRHLVEDKMQARGTGKMQILTRQPLNGIRRRGGLRFGEMERDALIEHGASYLLQERLMVSSDVYQAVVCRECGMLAISNVELGDFRCRRCNTGKFGRITIPYIFKVLSHMLAAANIKLTLKTREI